MPLWAEEGSNSTLRMSGAELWANVYGTECLARIDKQSGSVTGWVLLHGLLERERTWTKLSQLPARFEVFARNEKPIVFW